MRTWSLLALALSGLLVAGELSSADAADKDTLVIALDTLSAQVMDPNMDTRAPYAHYHASPIWDSLIRFDVKNGGIGPGAAERSELAPDGKRRAVQGEVRGLIVTGGVPRSRVRALTNGYRITPRPQHRILAAQRLSSDSRPSRRH
jgi:hypothetical protein